MITHFYFIIVVEYDLGVLVSDDLRWNDHYSTIIAIKLTNVSITFDGPHRTLIPLKLNYLFTNLQTTVLFTSLVTPSHEEYQTI